MIKKIAWDTFKNTGDVNTYLELKQIQNVEEQIQEQKVKQNGDNKNKWNNNRKRWCNAKENRKPSKNRNGTNLWNKSKLKNMGKSKRKLDRQS